MSGRVRLGMVGCGGFGRYHLRQFAQVTDIEVVALCDPDSSQLARTVEEFPGLSGAPQFGSHGDMYAARGLDAVLIGSPHTLHTGQTRDALSAGLHVLVDKPLAT